jgi:hypothetical protein
MGFVDCSPPIIPLFKKNDANRWSVGTRMAVSEGKARKVLAWSGWERRPTASWKLARAYDFTVVDDRFICGTLLT